jgi:voltage-gated potassium channel
VTDDRPVMSPTTLEELDRRQRRRLAVRSGVRIVVSTVVLGALYALLPAVSHSGARSVVELIGGLLIFVALLVWQVRTIIDAEHPEVRAAEALAVAIPVLIIVFAFTYLSLSHDNAANFSERLNHVGAIYFTVTMISTVGFGDIVPRTDLARILVTFQILLDLGVLVGLVRAVMYAARVGVQRRKGERDSELPGDGP